MDIATSFWFMFHHSPFTFWVESRSVFEAFVSVPLLILRWPPHSCSLCSAMEYSLLTLLFPAAPEDLQAHSWVFRTVVCLCCGDLWGQAVDRGRLWRVGAVGSAGEVTWKGCSGGTAGSTQGEQWGGFAVMALGGTSEEIGKLRGLSGKLWITVRSKLINSLVSV